MTTTLPALMTTQPALMTTQPALMATHPAPPVLQAYASGESWLLVKHNDLEAIVERHPLGKRSELLHSGVTAADLHFLRGEGADAAPPVAKAPPV